MITRDEQKKKAHELIDYIIDRNIYGDVLFKMENGNVVHMEFVKRMKMQTFSMRDLKVIGESRHMMKDTFPVSKTVESKSVNEKILREELVKK